MDDLKEMAKQLKECMKEYREAHKLVMEKHKHLVRIIESKTPLTNEPLPLEVIEPPLFVAPLEKPKLTRAKKIK